MCGAERLRCPVRLVTLAAAAAERVRADNGEESDALLRAQGRGTR